MVIVTKIVVCNEIYCKLSNRQEPYGCLFLLWPACYIYISMRYIVMMEDNQGGGAMDLGATPVG